MGKSTISMAIFKFANCNSWPGRVSSLFHPFYPHLGRCFASEIRSRDLFDFRFQKVAESGDCLNFQRDFSTFLARGKVMPEGENHKSQWFFTSILHDSSKFFMYSHASRLYLLISWSSKKNALFWWAELTSTQPTQPCPELLPTSEPQNGIRWIRRDPFEAPEMGGVHEKNGGTLW